MNKYMQKWIKALRSGKYKQGKHRLRTAKTGGYCCLGVACSVLAKETGNKTNSFSNHKTLNYSGYLNARGEKLLRIKGVQATLSHMNDSQNYTFEQIADFLEKKYK